jgi:hypothetical protein
VTSRVVKAVHGVQTVEPDPADELKESADLRATESKEQLLARYSAA